MQSADNLFAATRAARSPTTSLRILFLTTLLPGLRRTGSEVATQGFVDAMRQSGHDVTLLGYRRAGTSPPLSHGDVAVADRHIETLTAGARPALWMLRALLTGRPYSVAKYVSRAYSRTLAGALSGDPPDLVVLDHAQMGWLPRDHRDVPVVYLAHNVEHALHADMSRDGGPRAWAHRREERRMRPVEKGILDLATELWTLTGADATALSLLASGVPSRVFDIAPVAVPASPGPAVHDVVTLGGWHWKPNAAGLRWLVHEVAPHLDKHDLHVVVGGASGEKIVSRHPGVQAVGPVPDAMDFLQSGRVVVVPSTAGAGVQVKTLDAIASGRPVIATSTAMRGIADPPSTVRTVDDPSQFAAEIRRALQTAPDHHASQAARTWAIDRTARFQVAVRQAVVEASRRAS